MLCKAWPTPPCKILSALGLIALTVLFLAAHWPQNASYKVRYQTLNKALYLSLTRRCGILHVVSWKSAKQSLIASSTMAAEFIACYEASNHGVWLRNFVTELRIVDDIERALKLFCENKSTVLYSNNNRSSSKSKHIDIKLKSSEWTIVYRAYRYKLHGCGSAY